MRGQDAAELGDRLLVDVPRVDRQLQRHALAHVRQVERHELLAEDRDRAVALVDPAAHTDARVVDQLGLVQRVDLREEEHLDRRVQVLDGDDATPRRSSC